MTAWHRLYNDVWYSLVMMETTYGTKKRYDTHVWDIAENKGLALHSKKKFQILFMRLYMNWFPQKHIIYLFSTLLGPTTGVLFFFQNKYEFLKPDEDLFRIALYTRLNYARPYTLQETQSMILSSVQRQRIYTLLYYTIRD